MPVYGASLWPCQSGEVLSVCANASHRRLSGTSLATCSCTAEWGCGGVAQQWWVWSSSGGCGPAVVWCDPANLFSPAGSVQCSPPKPMSSRSTLRHGRSGSHPQRSRSLSLITLTQTGKLTVSLPLRETRWAAIGAGQTLTGSPHLVCP